MNIVKTGFGPWVKNGVARVIAPSHGQTRAEMETEVLADGYAKISVSILDRQKYRKKTELAAARYAEETGGTTLPGGMFIRTDARTQAALSNGAMMAKSDPAFVFQNWKLDDGTFTDMDAQTVTGIYNAVVAHVAACFAKEKSLCDAVDAAATIQEVKAIQW